MSNDRNGSSQKEGAEVLPVVYWAGDQALADHAAATSLIAELQRELAIERDIFKQVRECLQARNDEGATSPICDTVWFSEWEPLFDFMDSHIERHARSVGDGEKKNG
jgi:hypothetical protein